MIASKSNIITSIPGDKLFPLDNAIIDLAIKINKEVDKICRGYKQKYAMWDGNHCMQTSIATAVILKDILDFVPVNAYECIMVEQLDNKIVKYNHGIVTIDWVKGATMVIDFSRNDRKCFYAVFKSITELNKLEGYEHIVILQSNLVDLDKACEVNEYYTQQHSKLFIDRIRKKCKRELKQLKEVANKVEEEMRITRFVIDNILG